MAVYVKHGVSWVEAGCGQARHSGSWKDVKEVWAKHNDEWKLACARQIAWSYQGTIGVGHHSSPAGDAYGTSSVWGGSLTHAAGTDITTNKPSSVEWRYYSSTQLSVFLSGSAPIGAKLRATIGSAVFNMGDPKDGITTPRSWWQLTITEAQFNALPTSGNVSLKLSYYY